MKKRILSVVIAGLAAMSLTVSAFAVDAGSSNGTAAAEVSVTADAPVTVETDLGLVLDAEAGTFDASVTSIKLDAEVAPVEEAVPAIETAVATVNADATVTVNTKISITLSDQDGNAVQPVEGGKVKVTVASDGVSNAVAYVGDAAVEFIALTDNEDGTVSFETTHFSDFYLVTVDEAALEEVVAAGTVEVPAAGDTDTETEDKNQNTGVVLAVIPAAVAAAAIVVSKKRK